MNINDINEMSDDMFIDCFKNIFEKTPLIANLSLSKKPFKDKKHLIDVFMNEFEKLDNSQKINTLAMIAPITNEEKQKLLESVSLQDKIVTLGNIVNFYLHEVDFSNQTIQ